MIDWNRVLQMREEVGEELFGQLAADFLSEIEDRLARLSDDPEQLLRDLHFLRGAALNMGFARFSALCLADEMQLRHGNAAGIDKADLIEKFRSTRQQFLDDLPFIIGSGLPGAGDGR